MLRRISGALVHELLHSVLSKEQVREVLLRLDAPPAPYLEQCRSMRLDGPRLFWDELARLSDDPFVGIRVAETFNLRVLEALLSTIEHAGSLFEALSYARRFGALMDTRSKPSVTFRDGHVYVSWSHVVNVAHSDFCAAMLHRIATLLKPDAVLSEAVCLRGMGDFRRQYYEAHFQCPFREGDEAAGVMTAEQFLAPLPRSFPRRFQERTARLAGLFSQLPLGGLTAKVWDAYTQTATLSRVTFPDIAERLAVSEKELQGTLATLSEDHATLRRDAFVLRAMKELSHGDLAAGDVATAMGFRSRSSFQRAFKNATGITPGAYRRLRRPVVRRPASRGGHDLALDPGGQRVSE